MQFLECINTADKFYQVMKKTLNIRIMEQLKELTASAIIGKHICLVNKPLLNLPDGADSFICPFHVILFEKACQPDWPLGCSENDFHELSVSFYSPGCKVPLCRNGNMRTIQYILVFSKMLFVGSYFNIEVAAYTYWGYIEDEALHLSLKEKTILCRILNDIEYELRVSDAYSRRLLCTHTCQLLEYCRRFYERQFYIRTNWNGEIITQFKRWLGSYIRHQLPTLHCFPTEEEIAGKWNFSANYLNDLLRVETGKSIQEHIRFRQIEEAKLQIHNYGEMSIADIAQNLGFLDIRTFQAVFKKMAGCFPEEYRKDISISVSKEHSYN